MGRWHQTFDYGRFDPPEKRPGCYAIYAGNYSFLERPTKIRKKLIYIGTAINLYGRLKRHNIRVRRTDSWFLKSVKIRYVDDINERFALERALIKKLKPFLNKAHNGDKP